jgi:hypothetical protein
MASGDMIMNRGARISVEWGYENHSIVLTAPEWAKVKRGEQLTVKGEGYYYEREYFWDYWAFSGGPPIQQKLGRIRPVRARDVFQRVPT